MSAKAIYAGTSTLSATNGRVTLGTCHGNTSILSSGGNVEVLGVSGRLQVECVEADVQVQLLDASRGLVAKCIGGSVAIHMPSDMMASMNLNGRVVRIDGRLLDRASVHSAAPLFAAALSGNAGASDMVAVETWSGSINGGLKSDSGEGADVAVAAVDGDVVIHKRDWFESMRVSRERGVL